MHRVVGGIEPAEPGYRTVRVAPRPGGGLTWARTALDTRHGRISVAWRLDDGELEVELAVPDGVSAEVDLPDGQQRRLTGGRHRLTSAAGASAARA
jgi:alpha-L-rhamnosidase